MQCSILEQNKDIGRKIGEIWMKCEVQLTVIYLYHKIPDMVTRSTAVYKERLSMEKCWLRAVCA